MSDQEMQRRAFIVGGLAAIGTAHALATQAATSKPSGQKPPARRPNIIFILADDMGYGDARIYGSSKIMTPNIDRLAQSGMRFTQGYAGAPVCGPSRCALMTGLHTGHGRIRDNFALAGGTLGLKGKEQWRRPNLMPEDQTIADYLKAAGYKTGLMGKWHLDGFAKSAVPTKHGFDEFKGWLIQEEATQGYWPQKRAHNEALVDIPENADGRHGRYDTQIITDDAIDFMVRHRSDPFFLYVAYNSPHSPYTAPDFGPYADRSWPDDEKYYAAMIHYMDAGIGQLLDSVNALNLDEETIVFFASDNGPRSEPSVAQTRMADFFDSNGGLTGYKRDMYEGGIRDPWLVRWSGHIKPGAVSDVPVYFPDFVPTALTLAGAPVQKSDGIDLKPYLLDPAKVPQERFMYWEFYEPSFRQAARYGKWKGVRLERNGKIELYDLSIDPWESQNIAAAHPEMVKLMDEGMKREHVASFEYPDPKPGDEAKVSLINGVG